MMSEEEGALLLLEALLTPLEEEGLTADEVDLEVSESLDWTKLKNGSEERSQLVSNKVGNNTKKAFFISM